MIAASGSDAEQARAACSNAVEVIELPLDDSWLRDCGPIYVYSAPGHRLGVNFRSTPGARSSPLGIATLLSVR